MRDAPQLTAARRAEQAARDQRLAAALRENLRRRKEQARAKESEAAAEVTSTVPTAGAKQPQG